MLSSYASEVEIVGLHNVSVPSHLPQREYPVNTTPADLLAVKERLFVKSIWNTQRPFVMDILISTAYSLNRWRIGRMDTAESPGGIVSRNSVSEMQTIGLS